MENSFIGAAFPPHNVSPKKKADKEWGNQAAHAIFYHSTNSSAPSLFWNDRDSYSTFMKYAFGEQDPNLYKPALHINAKNQQHSFIGSIRWTIKNYATKRVQATVSRIFNRKYDPVATAIDPMSSDRRESFKSALKLWSKEQAWLQERQQMIGVDLLPEGVDISMLPENDEDLELYMQDYKLNNEIMTELGIKYHMNELDFDGIKEKFDQYITILPVAAVWCGLDRNNMPVVKTLNPARVLSPRSEFNDFKRMGYCGYVDDYTVAEFRLLAGNEFPEDELQRIVAEFSRKGDYHSMHFANEYPQTDRDVDTIQVMHFEVPTVDEYVYLQRTDKYGNERTVEKPYDYYRGKEDTFRSNYNGSRAIKRPKKQTVYGGYWIVGSDIVFGYGEKNYLKGELGYKLRASNMLNGRTTCLLKQMKPCLDNLETYDKKIQQLVASATPRIIKIDLFALRKASFKMQGKDMQTQDLLEMFFQTGVIITDTSDQSTGDTRKPIEVFKGGISDDIVRYVDLMKNELEQLDEIIGYNRVSSGASLAPDTGARVAQQMDLTTDVNLDHLYRADKGLCKEVYKALAHLHRISVRMNPDYYVPILGEEAVTIILTSAPFDEIGIDVEARPTQEEWNNFYNEINEMVVGGLIQPEDRVALRRFQSLKQAESYLRVVTRKRKKEKLAEQQMLIQQNGQVQQQSNDQTYQNAQALEKQRVANELMLKNLEMQKLSKTHVYKMAEIQLMNEGKIEDTMVDGEYGIKQVKARPSAQN